MKEKPLLFSGPMVLAVLEGRKLQTRRIIKPQPREDQIMPKNWGETMSYNPNAIYGDCTKWGARQVSGEFHLFKCPYGLPGDRLWVREAWRVGVWNEDSIAIDYRADGEIQKEWVEIPEDKAEWFDRIWRQSTEDAEKAGLKVDEDGQYFWLPGEAPTRWRPSIFLPRFLSRIILEVVAVRVERLTDISEADAIAEGIEMRAATVKLERVWKDYSGNNGAGFDLAKTSFATLWQSINGPGSWMDNPWVWVVEFKVVVK